MHLSLIHMVMSLIPKNTLICLIAKVMLRTSLIVFHAEIWWARNDLSSSWIWSWEPDLKEGQYNCKRPPVLEQAAIEDQMRRYGNSASSQTFIFGLPQDYTSEQFLSGTNWFSLKKNASQLYGLAYGRTLFWFIWACLVLAWVVKRQILSDLKLEFTHLKF